MTSNENWLSVTEFARAKRVTISYVYLLLRANKLQGAKKYDRTWRIPKIATLPSEGDK